MTTTDSPRAEAVAWLVGRLRFERLLADLHGDADVVAVVGPAEVLEAAPAARAA